MERQMNDTRLAHFLEAVVSGDQSRAEALAQQMTRQERDQIDQLQAVVQAVRLQRAGGRVQ